MTTFPVYLLQPGEDWQIVFPADEQDIGHTVFWEQTVSFIVAQHYGIPQKTLANLPYSQRRARIVGNTAYYGERPDAELLHLLREAVGNADLIFAFDEHERRLRQDVRLFRRLVKRRV